LSRFGDTPGRPRYGPRALAQELAERLKNVETFGGTCTACTDGEARAFLAKLRKLLDEMDGYPTR